MSTWNVKTLVSLNVEAASEEEALRLAAQVIVVEEPGSRRNPPVGEGPKATLTLGSRVRLDRLATEIDQPLERVWTTVRNNLIPVYGRSNVDGMAILATEQADQVRSIYRNAGQPTQVPTPTPDRLREEYTPYERHVLQQEHDERFGPDRGDL